MNEYDETHGINRKPAGAAGSTGGRFDNRDRPDAPDLHLQTAVVEDIRGKRVAETHATKRIRRAATKGMNIQYITDPGGFGHVKTGVVTPGLYTAAGDETTKWGPDTCLHVELNGGGTDLVTVRDLMDADFREQLLVGKEKLAPVNTTDAVAWELKDQHSASYLEATGPDWATRADSTRHTWARVMEEHDLLTGEVVFDAYIVDGERYSATFQFKTRRQAREFATQRLVDLAERLNRDPIPRPFGDWEPGAPDPRGLSA